MPAAPRNVARAGEVIAAFGRMIAMGLPPGAIVAVMSTDTPLNAGSTEPRGLLRLGTVPVAAAVFTGILALYYLLVAFTNWTDFGTNQAFVHHVLEMDTTFQDEDVMWRAIESDGLQNVAYVGVIIWESLIAIVLGWATVEWFRALARRGSYEKARQLATIGLVMIFVLFLGGFITIGGEYFQMWQGDVWNGLEPAFRNVVIAALGLLLIHLPSRDWGS